MKLNPTKYLKKGLAHREKGYRKGNFIPTNIKCIDRIKPYHTGPWLYRNYKDNYCNLSQWNCIAVNQHLFMAVFPA